MSRLIVVVLSLLICGGAEAKVNCVTPGPTQPKYCCQASSTAAGHWEVVKEYHDDCKCNADWSHPECTCRGIVFKTFCHHCMVNLPASNQMTTAYSSEELYTRCEDCVEKCKSEVPPMCESFFSAWEEEKFTAGSMTDVICSRDQLSQVLHSDTYPDGMKNALYRRFTPGEQARGERWMDSQWNIPQAPTHEAEKMRLKKAAGKTGRGSGFRAKMKKLAEGR